ncbi:MAG: ATP synthase F1 subunit gamma [Candidatus Dormibacteraceae bacterium]
MPSLRDLRRRIRSVQNTQKITRAQQVVSATKLRRAQQAVQIARPYAERMREVLESTAQLASEYRHPYLLPREGSRTLIVVVTSDRGLCGTLNTSVLRKVNQYAAQHSDGATNYVTIGRKGRDFLLRFGRPVLADASSLRDRPPIRTILPAISVAQQEFEAGRADTVLLAYSKWVSTLRQEAVLRQLLPVDLTDTTTAQSTADYLYEPGPEEVLDELLPRYVETQVYQALLENQASEHSARMIAMQNATNAAGDLIDSLTLTANKVRQAAITTELMEILSGAEALTTA